MKGLRQVPCSMLLLATVFLGCTDSVPGAAGTGALAVGAIGAGTGAIIGSVIDNGDIGKSAALGAAIGIPVGIIVGIATYKASDAYKEKQLLAQIRQNQQLLFEQQRSIDAVRMEVRSESPELHMPAENDDDVDPYLGPGLGNPFR